MQDYIIKPIPKPVIDKKLKEYYEMLIICYDREVKSIYSLKTFEVTRPNSEKFEFMLLLVFDGIEPTYKVLQNINLTEQDAEFISHLVANECEKFVNSLSNKRELSDAYN